MRWLTSPSRTLHTGRMSDFNKGDHVEWNFESDKTGHMAMHKGSALKKID